MRGERIEFCGRIGRKGKRIGGFKVYLFKKMSQKRGYMDGIHKKMIEKTRKRCYSKVDKKLFGSLNYFRGYYECDPFAGLVLVIL